MARKIKFGLNMPDKDNIRTIEELKQHFDLETVLEYYFNKKLLTWLSDRHYDKEFEQVTALDSKAADFKQELCKIFDAPYTKAAKSVTVDDVENLNQFKQTLRQYTSDETILNNAEKVVCSQQELRKTLQDSSEQTIYLFGKEFTIPMQFKNKTYIGINKPKINMLPLTKDEVRCLNIKFKDVELPSFFLQLIKEIEADTRKAEKKSFSSYHTSKTFKSILNSKDIEKSENIFYTIKKNLDDFNFDVRHDSKKIEEAIESAGLRNYYVDILSK